MPAVGVEAEAAAGEIRKLRFRPEPEAESDCVALNGLLCAFAAIGDLAHCASPGNGGGLDTLFDRDAMRGEPGTVVEALG